MKKAMRTRVDALEARAARMKPERLRLYIWLESLKMNEEEIAAFLGMLNYEELKQLTAMDLVFSLNLARYPLAVGARDLLTLPDRDLWRMVPLVRVVLDHGERALPEADRHFLHQVAQTAAGAPPRRAPGRAN